MTSPTPPSRTPAEIAEEEALRKQFAELQEQVMRDARMRLAQLDHAYKQNLERIAHYDRLIGKLDPFISEVEAGPPRVGDGPLLEKLRASRDLYQASKAMAEIQNQDHRANMETIRAAMGTTSAAGSIPQDLKFADSTHSRPYLLAKAGVDMAGARLALCDFREPVLVIQRLLMPQAPLPPDVTLDETLVKQLAPVVADAPEIKPVLSMALSAYQEAEALIKEAARALKGVREYGWEVSHLLGNTSAFYKLRGKVFYLERLSEQLAPYPPLAALFAKAGPASPPPFSSPAETAKSQARGTQPLGKQTRRMMPGTNPFAKK